MSMDEVVDHYQRDGYAVMPGLLSGPVLAQLREVTDRVADQARGLVEETGVFDFEDGHRPEAPQIQRIKKPHRVDPFYFELARHPAILAVIAKLIGTRDIRLNHSKINMKAAKTGSALEWHQDWAFAPHTNMSTCVASVMIDDCSVENGAMRVLAGSHGGPLLDHHDEEQYFVGAVAPDTPGLDFSKAAPLAGPAGTVAFHHPLAIHGSGANRSGASRRILFLEYAATDAWPLFYHVDWDDYNRRIVSGPQTSFVRFEPTVVKLPFPARTTGSIYKTQSTLEKRYFEQAV
ncbi:phytanoyl-CoA dioxygenase family protein [Telmatospirillum siberiense]|uniref:Phytanoyl-CoA dioxygenase family protein n=2 Tax=Telmatospirillum siberiense TaxID=382514 RepID=A0A2N3PPW6_9PROT|nr:phytanoyl-CoA dioxygenase family protein [Telmatospirillum siberiense]